MEPAIVFSFNILRSVHLHFGLRHFLPIKLLLQSEYPKSEILPIVNYEDTTIEQRAKVIQEKLPFVLIPIFTYLNKRA